MRFKNFRVENFRYLLKTFEVFEIDDFDLGVKTFEVFISKTVYSKTFDHFFMVGHKLQENDFDVFVPDMETFQIYQKLSRFSKVNNNHLESF